MRKWPNLNLTALILLPIKSTTIQEVPALLSVKSKPKSKPVKDSVQSRSHSNPKERSTSLGNQERNGYHFPVTAKQGKVLGAQIARFHNRQKAIKIFFKSNGSQQDHINSC